MSAQTSKFLSYGSLFVVAAVAVTGVVVAFQADAGPITGGPGVAPFTKLAVYQGVMTVVPTGGAQLMEIGNAGQDIASTGDVYLRPGSVAESNTVALRVYNSGGTAFATLPGRLGVGTTAPGTKLEVSSPGVNVVRLTDTLGKSWDLQAGIGGVSDSYFGIKDASDNLQVVTITNAGKIGIGTTSPGSVLTVTNGDVYVTSATSGIILKNGTTCARATLNSTFNGFNFATVTCP